MRYVFADCFRIIKNSKIYLAVATLFFVAGIILSFFCHNFEGVMFYLNVLERYLVLFDTTVSAGKYFISKILVSAGLCAFIFLTGLTVWTLPLHFIIFLYQGFVIGAVCPYFYKAYYISGIIFYIVALIPSMLLRFSFNAFYSTCCAKFSGKKLKCNNNKFSSLLLLILIVFMSYIIAVLWETIFIAIVIKPLNTYF